ncbi:Signal transduction response regulator, receiver region domain protein [Candidatus Magnetobacterium bavaricum]|uniref:Signal transduction response regulator, receiver region domain protein n=1 Tax=Candidatus Magnetobacterium bavaricum TaxID=29290 RepID=A0A0F3GT36_9BACT|nr:Signal transduction response regulator, receiver region domain protein [Candidatus Magnetobacterium bavaricum]
MLADDSITIQKVVELILSEEDINVSSVGDGQEAMSKLKSSKPDLILADIDMPKMNGYDLCREVKANPATAHIPVVLLVGAFEPINEQKVRDVGADDFLIKPFESNEFLKKIHGILQRTPSPSKPSPSKPSAKEPPHGNGKNNSDLEPLELGDSSMLDEKDMQALLEETMVEETAAFEEEHPDSDDSDDGGFADDDLTTKELQDIIETLKEPGPAESDSDDIDMDKMIGSLLEETVADNSDEDMQNTIDKVDGFDNGDGGIDTDTFKELMSSIADDMAESQEQGDDMAMTSMLEDIGDKLGDAAIEDVSETVFKEEDDLQDIIGSLREQEKVDAVQDQDDMPVFDSPPAYKKEAPLEKPPEREDWNLEEAKPPTPQYKAMRQKDSLRESVSDKPSTSGGVLLSINDVVDILRYHIDGKVSNLLKEGDLSSLFEQAINVYVDKRFKDITIGFDEIISEAINTRIDKLIGQVNIESIINQVISSTIKGVMMTLTGEMFKVSKEVTERITKQVLDESIPTLKAEVEKIIHETVSNVAERLIKEEIDQIKSEFL